MRIFICSPYRGDTTANIAIAEEMCRHALQMGYAPFAPHLFYPYFLDDSDENQRYAGIQAGLQYLKACDQVWVFEGNGITAGMAQEIEVAYDLGKKIVRFTELPRQAVK